MKNVLVVGPKQDYQSIIDVLYQEGTLHLQDVSGRFSQTESIFSPLESVSLDDLSALLIRINGIYLILPKEQGNPLEQDRIYEELRFKPTSELVTIISKVITDLELRTRELAVNKSDLELSKTSLERYAAIIDK
ncbi:MAG TPA: V-type ATP synthase subunit I, partial [Methanoregulaceae archaeon]|nr:V-type ATP synthase subunit I [Methanoregulaceae archaeon]